LGLPHLAFVAAAVGWIALSVGLVVRRFVRITT